MLINDNCCTYQIIQKEFNIGCRAIPKLVYEELHMKKLHCCWVPYDLTEQQKAELARICKENLKLHNAALFLKS